MSRIIAFDTTERLLEVLTDPELVAKGLAAVLSVAAIKERASRRWPTKQDAVWDYAQREFRKDFGPADHIVRLDDVHYLVVQPEETAPGARGRAVGFLRDLMQFFLGASAAADVRVALVTAIGQGRIEHAFLSPAEIEACFGSAPAPAPVVRTAPSPSVQVAPWLPPADEASSQILFRTEPIWAVRKEVIASCLLRPTFIKNGKPFDPLDPQLRTPVVIAGDLVVLDRALAILGERGRSFGLHAPIRLRTLNSIVGRQAVAARLLHAPPQTRERLVVDIEGIDEGTPRAVLETAVATLKPLCLGVAARAPGLDRDLSAWRWLRFSAVSFDFRRLGPGQDRDLAARLMRFAAMAGQVSPHLIGHSLATRARLVAAWAAGFTYLSGDVVEPLAEPFRPVRLRGGDFYTPCTSALSARGRAPELERSSPAP